MRGTNFLLFGSRSLQVRSRESPYYFLFARFNPRAIGRSHSFYYQPLV
ncbi:MULTISPECIES: hypothetical protein [unclassified Microcoleus]